MRLISSMGALALLALALPVFGAVGAGRATVKIPFEFEVSGKTLPAGTYVLETVGRNGIMQIRSSQGHEAYFMVSDANVTRPGKAPKLVFTNEEGRTKLKDLTLSRAEPLNDSAR